jgi:hypothetical protein
MSVTMISTARNLGHTVGVAVGVAAAKTDAGPPRTIPRLALMAKQLSKQASRLPQVLENMPDQPDQRIGKVAYAQSLTDVWILLCRMAGLGLIGSCCEGP